MEYEDHITITTPEGLELELLLAGVGSRLIASLLDLLVRGTVLLAVVVAAALIGSGVATAVAAICVFGLIFGYDILFETRASGRTPGKRWTGLRVICPSGRRVSLTTSAVRNLLRVVDFLPGAYAAGLACILVTRRNQRLGDLAAGTVVVRDRRGGRQRGRSAGPRAAALDPSQLTAWDVSAISAQEIAAVRQFLARRERLDPGARAGLAQQLAAALRGRVAGAPQPLGAEGFLESVSAAKAQRE